ncbi:hypothetical protein HAX54_015082 [Datura stramonium]|uniref:Squalene cyclase C-terminal domain-containing protein n=1 Tax=Datura stramonium TaxID=4076 RepID=A0ABS8TR53_DATST|nr:hypothetical protein [Datura stramonium]
MILGSQAWDTSFAIQALLVSEMNDEISDTLRKGHDFIKKYQIGCLNHEHNSSFNIWTLLMYVECTGSSVQALVQFKSYTGHRTTEINNFIHNAIKYFEDVQKPDGSWYDCWGVRFTYTSWLLLGGLAAAGKSDSNTATVRKGVEFLLRTQRSDGGWGESYRSGTHHKNVQQIAFGAFLKTPNVMSRHIIMPLREAHVYKDASAWENALET